MVYTECADRFKNAPPITNEAVNACIKNPNGNECKSDFIACEGDFVFGFPLDVSNLADTFQYSEFCVTKEPKCVVAKGGLFAEYAVRLRGDSGKENVSVVDQIRGVKNDEVNITPDLWQRISTAVGEDLGTYSQFLEALNPRSDKTITIAEQDSEKFIQVKNVGRHLSALLQLYTENVCGEQSYLLAGCDYQTSERCNLFLPNKEETLQKTAALLKVVDSLQPNLKEVVDLESTVGQSAKDLSDKNALEVLSGWGMPVKMAVATAGSILALYGIGKYLKNPAASNKAIADFFVGLKDKVADICKRGAGKNSGDSTTVVVASRTVPFEIEVPVEARALPAEAGIPPEAGVKGKIRINTATAKAVKTGIGFFLAFDAMVKWYDALNYGEGDKRPKWLEKTSQAVEYAELPAVGISVGASLIKGGILGVISDFFPWFGLTSVVYKAANIHKETFQFETAEEMLTQKVDMPVKSAGLWLYETEKRLETYEMEVDKSLSTVKLLAGKSDVMAIRRDVLKLYGEAVAMESIWREYQRYFEDLYANSYQLANEYVAVSEDLPSAENAITDCMEKFGEGREEIFGGMRIRKIGKECERRLLYARQEVEERLRLIFGQNYMIGYTPPASFAPRPSSMTAAERVRLHGKAGEWLQRGDADFERVERCKQKLREANDLLGNVS